MSIIYDALQKTQLSRENKQVDAIELPHLSKKKKGIKKQRFSWIVAILFFIGLGYYSSVHHEKKISRHIVMNKAIANKYHNIAWHQSNWLPDGLTAGRPMNIAAHVPAGLALISPAAKDRLAETDKPKNSAPFPASFAQQVSRQDRQEVEKRAAVAPLPVINSLPVKVSATTSPANPLTGPNVEVPVRTMAAAHSALLSPANKTAPVSSLSIGTAAMILNGIMVSKEEKTVMINHQFFHLGDTVAGMKIVDIKMDQVKLMNDKTSLVLRMIG